MAHNAKHPQFNLLLTRPLSGGKAFWHALPEGVRQNLHPIFSPLMEIKAVPAFFPPYEAVIFTSANGVKYSPKGAGRVAYCVGAVTTQKAKHAGWKACQLGETAEELIAKLENIAPSGPLLHLAGRHIREDISSRLSRNGIKTQHIVVYDQVLQGLNQEAHAALLGKFPLLLPLFSPRSASNFIDQCHGSTFLHVVAMSHEVAKRLEGLICRQLIVAERPTRDMMLKAVQMVAGQCTSG